MSKQGSFYPLRREIPSAEPVLFAYVLDTVAVAKTKMPSAFPRAVTPSAPTPM